MNEDFEEQVKTPEGEYYLAKIDLIVAAVLTVACAVAFIIVAAKHGDFATLFAASRAALILALMMLAFIGTLVARIIKFFKCKKKLNRN